MNPIFLVIAFLILIGAIVYLVRGKIILQNQLDSMSSGKAVDQGSKLEARDLEEPLLTELDQLREQLSSFNQAMDQCPSSILITDLDGNIEYINTQFTEISG